MSTVTTTSDTTIPYVDSYIDKEEKALYENIESNMYRLDNNTLDQATIDILKRAARNTINDERQKISLRIPKNDLSRLKTIALKQGIPYQTAINSIIHTYISSHNDIKRS